MSEEMERSEDSGTFEEFLQGIKPLEKEFPPSDPDYAEGLLKRDENADEEEF